MRKTVLLILLALTLTGCADTNEKQVDGGTSVFEDTNLEQVIRKQLINQDKPINMDDLKEIKSINMEEVNLVSLKGIEKCTNLETLIIPHASMNNLQYLSGLKNLKTLELGKTTFIDFKSLANCASLKELSISSSDINNLQGMELCKTLKLLNINNCNINSLNGLNQNTSLKKLVIYGGSIKCISGCEQCRSLSSVVIQGSKVDDFSKIGSLCELNKTMSFDFSYNELSSIKEIIPLIGKAKVEELILTHNQLENLEGIDQIKEPKEYYFNIDVSYNHLTSIEGIQQKCCLYVNVSNNKLTDISPLCIKGYGYLYCKDNPIKDYSPAALIEDYYPIDPYMEISDITFPKKIKIVKVNTKFSCMEKSPVLIKGQDLFVSPKYLLHFYSYKAKINKDKIELVRGNKKIIFTNHGRTMTYNGKSYTSPYPAYQKDGVTYIPLKYFVEKLGGSVEKVNREILYFDYRVKLPASIIPRNKEEEEFDKSLEEDCRISYINSQED